MNVPLVALQPDGLWFHGARDSLLLSDNNAIAFRASRNRRQCAVVRGVDGGVELSVVDIYDRTRRVLWRSSSTTIGRPSWGPNDRLTVASQDASGAARVLSVGPDGRMWLELSSSRPHSYAEPDWSPNGRWLAVEGQPLDELRGMTVFVKSSDQRDLRLVDPLEVPEPKAACPRFGPSNVLVYSHTPTDLLESQVRLFDPVTGSRSSVQEWGLDDPVWTDDGKWILAAKHQSICPAGLSLIESSTLRTSAVWSPSGVAAVPVGVSDDTVLLIARECSSATEMPIGPGTLWSVPVSGSRASPILSDVLLAQIIGR